VIVGVVVGAAVWWLITWGMDEFRNLANSFIPGTGRNPFIPLALTALGIAAATLFIERAPWRLAGAAGVMVVMFVLGGYGSGYGLLDGDVGFRLLRTAHEPAYMTTTAVWVSLAIRRLYSHLRPS
jgi:hypothetical protein